MRHTRRGSVADTPLGGPIRGDGREAPGGEETLEKRGNVWNERKGSYALEQPLPGSPE